MECRTDLAVELKENIEGSVEGISFHKEEYQNEVEETMIQILNEEGSKNLGKPKGTYITLECIGDLRDHEEAMEAVVTKNLKKILKDKNKILVVGLGNHNVTPDALGPLVLERTSITRHLLLEGYMKDQKEITGLVPGVMAQTGMESLEIIKAVVNEMKPDAIIAIDALASCSVHRLNRTIQISDTGISPGAGVGNRRQQINEETVGVKVIAIGVPTVIAVQTIIVDAMDNMLSELGKEQVGKLVHTLSEEERYHLASELVKPCFKEMFVTPKNIDQSVIEISDVIANGLNEFLVS